MLEDNEYLFVFENGKLEKVFKKDILDGKFIILSYIYENGKKRKSRSRIHAVGGRV